MDWMDPEGEALHVLREVGVVKLAGAAGGWRGEARGCGGRGPRHTVDARFARRAVTWTEWTEWTGWTRKAKRCMRGGRLVW